MGVNLKFKAAAFTKSGYVLVTTSPLTIHPPTGTPPPDPGQVARGCPHWTITLFFAMFLKSFILVMSSSGSPFAFCFISLGCDVFGRFNLAYGIDSRILNMVSDNMASTLLRRIYEFTPGELEPFVGFVSLDMDCITYFENSIENVDNHNCKLIEVKRNEEKSIQDMFNNLELRDDVDEEPRKWLRR